MRKILVLGAGNNPYKALMSNCETILSDFFRGKIDSYELTTVDIDEKTKPTIIADLNKGIWYDLLGDVTYDEVHAYEILEHLGKQGDFKSFFSAFNNIHDCLERGGHLLASVPSWKSVWAWGDPGHTRVINEGSLAFLCRREYEKQIGVTAMTDYRRYIRGYWEVVNYKYVGDNFNFILRAV